MHKIAEKEFTVLDFSEDHLMLGRPALDSVYDQNGRDITMASNTLLGHVINHLNMYRKLYLDCDRKIKGKEFSEGETIYTLKEKQKQYWWQMIQLLPSSYNQTRNVMMNYEVLSNIYKSRKNHKLDEWKVHETPEEHKDRVKDFTSGKWGFCDWIKTLPYQELITGEE